MSQTFLTQTGLTKIKASLMVLAISCGCSDTAEQQPRPSLLPGRPRTVTQIGMPRPVAFAESTSTISMLAPDEILPLGPGDTAPALQLAKFVQGEAIDEFQDGQIYIIEFWATWCSSCRQTLPYVAQLQSDYSDDVTVVGITAEDEQTVVTFLDEEVEDHGTWGQLLNFRVALDDQRKTQKLWRETSADEGLPFAMIVGRTGLIEWEGHPSTIAIPLKKIVDGRWDRQVARDAMKQEVQGQSAIDRSQQAIVTAVNAGNYREAVQITDRMLKKLPDNKKILSFQKQLMLDGKLYRQMNTVLGKLVRLNHDDPTELNAIAWNISVELDIPERDLDLALKAALRASELTDHQSGSILDTVARVHYERGELQEAVKWQEKAAKIQPTSEQLAKVLEEYRSELASEAAEN